MRLEGTRQLAVEGRLYPSVILHGGDAEARQEAALTLARTLLCDASAGERPCGRCHHCRRIAWPGSGESASSIYHPDFQVLVRDLKTSTSVDATRRFLLGAQVSPFEARGQVFVIAAAESLSGEAANALLKSLEEPHTTSPRNFFLLAPSRLDLLPTLRSRSLSIFLGPAEPIDPGEVEPLAEAFARSLGAWARTGAAVHLLAAAGALSGASGWEDPRAGRPWAVAARAVLQALDHGDLPAQLRRPLLALAEELLAAPQWRLRGITKERILEGLVSRHLGR